MQYHQSGRWSDTAWHFVCVFGIIIPLSSPGGETISIDGSGFGSNVPYVTVNGEQLTVTSNNDVRLEAEFPPLAPGSYPLQVLVDGKGLADIRWVISPSLCSGRLVDV